MFGPVAALVADCSLSAPPVQQFVPKLAILSSCDCLCVYSCWCGLLLKSADYIDGKSQQKGGAKVWRMRGKNQQSVGVDALTLWRQQIL